MLFYSITFFHFEIYVWYRPVPVSLLQLHMFAHYVLKPKSLVTKKPDSDILIKSKILQDPRDAPPPTRAETREERMERKLMFWGPGFESHHGNLTNYRPTSLLSNISKMMEGVINSAIKQHLLSDAQFGFCQG
eukprot:g27019.t1